MPLSSGILKLSIFQTIFSSPNFRLQGEYYLKNYLIEDKGIFPEILPGHEKWRMDIIYKLGNNPKPVGGYRCYGMATKIPD